MRTLFCRNEIEYNSDDNIFDGYVAGIGDGVLLEYHLDILYREIEKLQEPITFSAGEDIEMSISPGGQTKMYDGKTNEQIKAVHIDRVPNLVNRLKAKKLIEEIAQSN